MVMEAQNGRSIQIINGSGTSSHSLDEIVENNTWSQEIDSRYLPDIAWKKDHGIAVAEIMDQLLNQTLDEYDPNMEVALQLNRASILLAAKHHDDGITNLGPDVSDEMLKNMVNKNGRLNADEEALMDRHPLTGAELVLPHNPVAAGIIALHHTFQKRSYPDSSDPRLQRILNAIPSGQLAMVVEASRMLALADTARAIMEPRPYSLEGKPESFARSELLKEGRWSPRQIELAVRHSTKTLQAPRRMPSLQG